MQKIRIPFDPFPDLEARIPKDIKVHQLAPKSIMKAPEPKKLLFEALENPMGSSPISQMLQEKAKILNKALKNLKILLLCDDHTRMTPLHLLIPWFSEILAKCGISFNNITILIAGGSHRSMTPLEIEEKFGEWVCSHIEIVQHEFNASDQLISLGTTHRGIEVIVNKIIQDYDFICALGNIVPHEIAGFSGGAKMILPGISTKDTVGEFHWLSTKTPFNRRLGSISNPIRSAINDVLELVQLDFIINTVLNSAHEIVKIYAGHPITAHQGGCIESKRIYGVSATATEIVLTDTEPEHTDFWTAVKGIIHTASFVQEGGILICATACPEGLCKEHPQILEMGYNSPEHLEKTFLIRKHSQKKEYNRLTATHCANLWEIIQHCEIFLVTEGISKHDAEFLGFRHFTNLQAAVNEALELKPKCKSINLIRNGAEILFAND